jgi:hypothetical protein
LRDTLGLDNEAYNRLFNRTGFVSGLLLGTGQASHGISEDMGATAFQAIVGAAFIAADFPDSLNSCWPQEWSNIWQVIAPGTPRPADPTTILQEATSAMRLLTGYEISYSGPQHHVLYKATLALNSETLGISAKIEGSSAATKTRAKHEASAVVLQVLDWLAQPVPEQEATDAPRTQANLARFLLAHQAALLATSSVPLQRWIAKSLFGLHLAASPTQLISWAESADRLLDSRNTMRGSGVRLEEAFRGALEDSAQHEGAIDEYLARVLGTLEQVTVPDDPRLEHLEWLIQMSSIYRCLGADDPDIDILAFAEDLQILYQGRLAIPSSSPVWLTGRQRAILDNAIATVLAPGTTAAIEVDETRPFHIRIARTAGAPLEEGTIAEICALWSRIDRTTVLHPAERGIDLNDSGVGRV